MTFRHRSVVFALTLLCSSLLAGSALAELANWDQTRVTNMAKELVEKVEGVATALRQGPQSNIGSGQSASFYRLKQDVRRIRTEAKHLASQLEAGKSREETAPVFEDLMVMRNSAAEEARRMFMPDQTLAAITSAGDVLNRLRPYFVAEAPAPAE